MFNNRDFWKRTEAKYEDPLFYAVTTSPHPKAYKVDHLFSGGLALGSRHWAFATKAQRDRFVRAHRTALACERPE